MSGERVLARDCACALLVTPDGRYLMQLRDPKPSIILPDHWGCFGGSIDPGESAEAALHRELFEELEFRPTAAAFFIELVIDLPFAPVRTDRLRFFAVPIVPADVERMVQHEGAGRRLFTLDELAAEPRVAPWDLAAILMHGRRSVLFAPPEAGVGPQTKVT